MSPDELEAEIFRAFDGEMDKAGMAALETKLLNDPEARRVFRKLVHFQNALEIRMQSNRANETRGVIPIDRILYLERRTWIHRSAAAAVILVLCVLGILWWQIGEKRTLRHEFHVSTGAVYSVTHPDGHAGDATMLTEGSRLTLESGIVECWFKEGVRAVLQGPCDLTVNGSNSVSFDQGIGWFYVAKGAEGFTVTTPEIEIKDLGTEFGIASRKDNFDEVQVFSGKVRLTSRGPRTESMVVAAGETFRADPIGRLVASPHPDSSVFERLSKESLSKQPDTIRHRISSPSVLASGNAAPDETPGDPVALFDDFPTTSNIYNRRTDTVSVTARGGRLVLEWKGDRQGFSTLDFYRNAERTAIPAYAPGAGRFPLEILSTLKIHDAEQIGDGMFSVGVFYFDADDRFLGEASLLLDTPLGGNYTFDMRNPVGKSPELHDAASFSVLFSIIGDPETGDPVDGFSFESFSVEP